MDTKKELSTAVIESYQTVSDRLNNMRMRAL
jgi:hypothetical protein